jgi:hypothetical protein
MLKETILLFIKMGGMFVPLNLLVLSKILFLAAQDSQLGKYNRGIASAQPSLAAQYYYDKYQYPHLHYES